MVNIDHLQFRKNKVRQPMQYAWCAAATRNFVGINANKISRKEIVDLDIGSLCDDIMSKMSDSQEGMRCTLYLSSMLCFGTVKLFQEQTTFVWEDSEKLMLNLLGGQNLVTQKKKKKTKGPPIPEAAPEMNISLTPLPTPTFDPEKTFGNKNVEDRHLLSEIDFIGIPQPDESFGFNPNEKELTDRDIADFYREMMGEDSNPLVTEDMPQDNDHPFRGPLEMNDQPMHQEPAADPIENQLPPSRDPQAELKMMKTPKRPTRSEKSKQKPAITPENAKTAYSPPKKRSRISAPIPYDDDNDDMMIGSEATREPALPGEIPLDAGHVASPIFDFRKQKRRNIFLKNLDHDMNKSKDVTAMLDEPILDAPMPQESPPHVDPVDNAAHVNLPDVSFHEPPPATEPPEENAPAHYSNVPLHASPAAAAQPNENDSAHIPTPSSIMSESDLILGSLRSFEENSRKKYIKRGNKIFADRTRQIEIEARPPFFMTLTRNERLFSHAIRKESVDSLLNYPASLRRERFLPEYRHWSGQLLHNYCKTRLALAMAVPPKEKAPAQKRKKRGQESGDVSHSNKEAPDENMEIVQEQPQNSSLKNIDANDQPPLEIPDEHRANFIPEDNPVNMESFEPPVEAAPVDMQTENPENQITNDFIHDAPHEFEQPPIVEPVIEGPALPEINDQVEAAMSPTKRFKSRDDQELQNMETRSKKSLTTYQLFKIIQSLWDKLTITDIERLGFISVEFEKVVKPGYYSIVEAGRYLYHCFLLEDKKKLYLQQKIPYDTIYLIKW